MAKGFKHGAGGGGASLNFKVFGGTSKPTNPKENTIWVNTDTDISGWVFSSEQPQKPVKGMVWFQTGTSAATAFNALKKNNITVYPTGCQQYVGGSWVIKTAKIYQNRWIDWVTYLYNNGDECVDITGGWTSKKWTMSPNAGTTSQTYNIEKTDSYMKFTKTGQIGVAMHTEYMIDLTNVKTIHFKGEMKPGKSNGHWTAFYVWPNLDGKYWDSDAVASVLCEANTIKTNFVLDVSDIEGEYYVGFCIYDATCYVKVEDLYMELSGSTNPTISVTESSDGTVTMVNTLADGGTETWVISPDANGNPSNITYNSTEIPITWAETTSTEETGTGEDDPDALAAADCSTKSPIASISVTTAADGSVTMVNTLSGGGTETLAISADANGNPNKLTYNGTEIPITWNEVTA